MSVKLRKTDICEAEDTKLQFMLKPESNPSVRPLTGNIAVLGESAFSGLIIKLQDDETVLVQYFRPNGVKIVYEKPVVRKIKYDKTDSAGFKYYGHFYHLADFMRI